jgi:BolA family transcriptional regulator, general stress-responsive regulator
MNERMRQIEERLRAALAPDSLELVDESAQHAGHEGARGGGGHFALTVVSERFAGKGPIERHRMVYAALGDAMRAEIHALSIRAYTPDEL